MKSTRVFDHLDGTPRDEDRRLSRAAHEMRRSASWSVPSFRQDDEGGTVSAAGTHGERRILVRGGMVFHGLIGGRR